MDRANDSTCDLPRRMGASRTAPAAPCRPASGPCYRTPSPTVERWAERTVLTSHSGNARRRFFHALTLRCHAKGCHAVCEAADLIGSGQSRLRTPCALATSPSAACPNNGQPDQLEKPQQHRSHEKCFECEP